LKASGTCSLGGGGTGLAAGKCLIVADDIGNNDVGAFGSPDIRTPHIDGIAAHGIKMSTGYVTASVCLPSRAGIMTGRYPERFGVYDNPRGGGPNVGLPVAETTIAEMLKPLGYATAAIGKWHLGAHPSLHPNGAGFDLFYGFKLSLHHYFSYPGDEPIQRNGVPVPDPDYTTTGFGQEAVNFVDQHAGQPLFLYLAFNAAHEIEPLPSYLAQYHHIPNPTRREYAAVVTAMDDQIGNILAHALLLTGQPQVPHEELFWKRNELEAARIDNWKLVDQGGPDMLFDLSVFPVESLNVAAFNQTKSLEVRAKLEQ
jgi:arylsulfatase A-like enzyme